MNELMLLQMISELVKENKALKRSLAEMLDRLEISKISNEPTLWELYSPDFDREADTAQKLLIPNGLGKSLQ